MIVKKIVYIGNFLFPDGNAAGKRVFSNGKLFETLGYDVYYIGKSDKTNQDSPKVSFDNRNHYELTINKVSILNQLFSNGKIIKQLYYILQNIGLEEIDYVILYGELNNSMLNYRLIKWLHTQDIKVIIDCVEWWDERGGSLLFRVIKNINTSFLMKKVNLMSDGIIGISKYLSSYYSNQNMLTVTIPPLALETIAREEKSYSSKRFKIIYAGIPFRLGINDIPKDAMKDRLDFTVEILLELKKTHHNIAFDIYGITIEEYLQSVSAHGDIVEENKQWIKFHGKQENEFILNKICESDATILIRDESLVTKAGFSTKIVESISLKTPIITTDVGDIKDYIPRVSNAGLVMPLNEDASYYANEIGNFIDNYLEIQTSNNDDLFNVFYYKNYINVMQDFLNKLI